MAQDYNKLATDQLDPQYNQKITALRNALNQSITNLDNSKAGINSNFDTQVNNQNISNSFARQNFNNNVLSRGLARSTIATSGISGIDNTNQRLVGNINQARGNALNDVESQKSVLSNNFESTKAQLEADKLKDISTLARELENQDYTRTREEQARQDALKQQALDNAFREKQFAASKSSSKAASSPKFNATLYNQSRNEAFGNMYQDYQKLLDTDPVAAGTFLKEHASDFIGASDKKTYDGVMSDYKNYMTDYNIAQNKAKKEAQAKALASKPNLLQNAFNWVKNGLVYDYHKIIGK